MGAVGKTVRWTPDRLRSYEGFEKFSDKESEEAIDTLERLARILLSIYKQNNLINEESGDTARVRQRPQENKDG